MTVWNSHGVWGYFPVNPMQYLTFRNLSFCGAWHFVLLDKSKLWHSYLWDTFIWDIYIRSCSHSSILLVYVLYFLHTNIIKTGDFAFWPFRPLRNRYDLDCNTETPIPHFNFKTHLLMILSAKFVQYPMKQVRKRKRLVIATEMFLLVWIVLALLGIQTATNLSMEISTTHHDDIIWKVLVFRLYAFAMVIKMANKIYFN